MGTKGFCVNYGSFLYYEAFDGGDVDITFIPTHGNEGFGKLFENLAKNTRDEFRLVK